MSRQRHDSKRNDARTAPAAQRQRRQTPKSPQTARTNTRTNKGSNKTPHATQPSPQPSPQKSMKSTKAVKAPQTAKTLPQATTAATNAPKKRTDISASQSRATKAPTSKETAKSKKTAVSTTSAAAAIVAPVEMIAEAAIVAQMPEIPEVPETPETPEIPEIPETPDVPEIPEIPATPDAPEMPEVPETPDTPEVPEVPEQPEPEQPEQPTEPDSPTEPTEPVEPVEPGEPDNPAVQADEQPYAISEPVEPAEPDFPDVHVVPVVPVATEKRMPTLAVMAQSRRESSGATDQSALAAPASPGSQTADREATSGAVEKLVDTTQAPGQPAAAKSVSPRNSRAGHIPIPSLRPSRAQNSRASARAQQQASAITRPVETRFSHRRGKATRTPDFIWENDPRLPYLPWPMRRRHGSQPHPLPPASLVTPVVVFQIFAMAILGLTGALQGIGNVGSLGTWMLAGALIAGVGGAIAYGFNESAALQRFAPGVLMISQLGLLVWGLLLVGPRASLLALVPALIEVALLMADALLASAYALLAMLIYALFAGLSLSVGMTPAITLNPAGAVALDVLCVVVGLLAGLWLLLAIQSGRERAQALARARRHEADVLRNLVTQFRQEIQDDTGKLEAALIQALKGQNIGPIPTEGMYRLLAETIMDTASRLEVLQRDREERLRLEGSLRVLIRAVERQWLGVDPDWPGHTATPVDELVALLRTPRLDLAYHKEAEPQSTTPRLIPIPTLAVEHDTPPPAPISRPLSGAAWMSPRRRSRRAELYPLPSADDDSAQDSRNSDQLDKLDNTSAGNGHGYWPSQDDR